MELHLSAEERIILEAILLEHQRVLLHEISRADGREYRAMLRQKEQLLETMLGKVRDWHDVAA